ncbi:hypothetical protein N7474_005428 [Penicillium riverlandense]|uniref:uncharacterized protein n=1 Tax=Penicillium riverlandense TaxID=1903569 RepID=UPI00254762A9|nr:uncharacterized protein N7474_005428 [Penicillium riverlandense]KAJ5819837.1 hypothetical protein N7474_005428 [Penicillium riverlandense]
MASTNPTPQPTKTTSTTTNQPRYRAIRATYSPNTITVYQAYPSSIATPALAAQTFVPPFSRTRMTWIKPSFLWMAYRSGYGTKPGQERVLAIEITREGFEWALRHSCLSHWGDQNNIPQSGTGPDYVESKKQWQEKLHSSPVRIQWDPERDLKHRPSIYRSIQSGLGPLAVAKYVDEWIVSVTDVTDLMREVSGYVDRGDLNTAFSCLPDEREYPLPEELRAIVHASPL